MCAHHICLSATSTVLNNTASFHNTPGAMWHLSPYYSCTTALWCITLQHSGCISQHTAACLNGTAAVSYTALWPYCCTLLHPITITAHCCMPVQHWLHCSILLCPLTIVAHCCMPVQHLVALQHTAASLYSTPAELQHTATEFHPCPPLEMLSI